ncbi:BUD13 homolog [Haliotis rufescens]|uniref:BUD13 homolog n=1 Tax=Haliotis rufescens TaxID=6454 RepID=UPI001EB001D3|nr:BUD13 homolog [Haliotis rufescens]
MAVSKEEYLKRYMSSDGRKEKKKRKKKDNASGKHGMQIIDDDITVNHLLPSNLHNTLEEDVGDNEPTVADVIDERPEHIKRMEEFQDSQRWKGVNHRKTDDGSPEYGVIKRRGRHDSDSDQSSPRRQRHDSDSDQSPRRKGRHDSDSDQSPPRKGRHDSDSDQSPPRKGRYNSDSDQSPSRKSKSKHSSSQSKQSRKGRHDSDSDQSPPRRGRNDSDSDQSPPRRQKQSDQSPSRRHKEFKTERDSKQRRRKSRFNHSDSDNSPPRKRRHGSDSDSSPPRRIKKEEDVESKRKATKTLGGAKAGLSSAREMKQEAAKMRKKEDDMFRKIDEDMLGKNAKTVFREKGGKKRNFAEEKEKEEEAERQKAIKEKKYEEWGKGLKQKEALEQRVSDTLHEAAKPLARYRDDDDLDELLKTREREGDPMAAFLKKKKKNKDPNVKEKPKYSGPAPPPNRFKIMPGYRWDGVDRSNGFEKQIFTKMSEKRATEKLAYKWSVEDM